MKNLIAHGIAQKLIRLVLAWVKIHRKDLQADWALAPIGLRRIEV
jgi:hypothetical protein